MTMPAHATQARATDLAAFDQEWLAAMEQTPLVGAVIGLSGLTRLGERPAALERLATIVELPLEQTASTSSPTASNG